MLSFKSAFCLIVIVAAANAGYASSYANHNQQDDHVEEYHHAPTPYKFQYGVKDFHTGDNKDAWEHSDGHVVKGGYSFQEADGTKRVVEYTADKNGFNSVVKRIGHANHPETYQHHHEQEHHEGSWQGASHGAWQGASQGAWEGASHGAWQGASSGASHGAWQGAW